MLAAGNYAEVPKLLVPMSIVLPWLYIFCHFGDHVTQRYDDLENYYYHSVAWNYLSIDVQKDWLLMITLGQKKVYIRGFASAYCTRELFMKVKQIELISL